MSAPTPLDFYELKRSSVIRWGESLFILLREAVEEAPRRRRGSGPSLRARGPEAALGRHLCVFKKLNLSTLALGLAGSTVHSAPQPLSQTCPALHMLCPLLEATWTEGQGVQEVVVNREKVEERLLAGLAIHRAGCDAHMRGWEPCSYSSEDSQCWILSRSSSMIGFHGSTFSG